MYRRVSEIIIRFVPNYKKMTLLDWYSYSASGFFGKIGSLSERSFHLIQRIGGGPNVFYITLLCVLFLVWMVAMRNYDRKAKDKGLID